MFSTRTRMPSRAALRVFRVGNLLACIFKSILRAVKKPFRASLSYRLDLCTHNKLVTFQVNCINKMHFHSYHERLKGSSNILSFSYIPNNTHETLLDSDWLTAAQFNCNTSTISVTTVQITL